MENIRILIADDHPVFRDGIRRLLDEQEGIEVVGQANDGEEAVVLAKKLEPDLVIMDIMMPKLSGIDATKEIKTEFPGTAVLLLSGYDNEPNVLAALRAGAAGFLSKGAHSSEIVHAVKSIRMGEPVLDQSIAYKILTRMVSAGDSETKATLEELHDRELEVLKLAAKGMTNRSIADELFISERTVQTHFANIFRKSNVGSRTEAVLRALKEGWLSPGDLP